MEREQSYQVSVSTFFPMTEYGVRSTDTGTRRYDVILASRCLPESQKHFIALSPDHHQSQTETGSVGQAGRARNGQVTALVPEKQHGVTSKHAGIRRPVMIKVSGYYTR